MRSTAARSSKDPSWTTRRASSWPRGEAGSRRISLRSTLNANFTATRVQGRAQADVFVSKFLRLKGGVDLEGGQWDYTLTFPQIPGPDSPDIGPLFGQKKLTSTRSFGYFDPAAFAN